MKKSLLTIAALIAAMIFTVAVPQAVFGQATTSQPEIKDPAEYNAYVNAIQAANPNAKVAALEGFLQQYPNSVMKQIALEQLMAGYQAANNAAKTVDAAQRLLQVDPCSVRALAVLAFVARINAESNQNPEQNAQQAGDYGKKGLDCLEKATPSEGQSAADFEKLKTALREVFAGAVGRSALQKKDYPAAQQAFQQAVEANPSNLQNVYPLAVSYLEPKPMNPLGLYYAASAVNLAAGTPAQAQLEKYTKGRYQHYHGGEDGYAELLAKAKASPLPPAGFAVAPAPTPAEQADKIVKSKAVKEMSFDEIQMVLTVGKPEAAAQVWDQIKGKFIAIEGKLISSVNKVMIAGTVDDIDANKPDIDLTLTTAVTAKAMPAAGSTIDFQGMPVSYEPNPFMMHMEKGAFIGKTKKEVDAAAALRKPAAGHRPLPKH